MLSKKYIFIFLSILFYLSACYKDEIIVDDSTTSTIEHTAIIVNGHIAGSIKDEFGKPITALSAELDEDIYSIQDLGLYHFYAENVDQHSTPIHFFYSGNEYQFTVNPLDNEINYFSHTIFTQTNKYTGTTDQTASLHFPDGSNISIAANTYTNYSGELTLKSYIPDLQNPIHLESLPGNHLATDDEGNQWWLDFNKAIYIDITSANGTNLTIEKDAGIITIEEVECTDCGVWRYDPIKHVWTPYLTSDELNGEEFMFTESGFYALANARSYNLVEGRLLVGNIPIGNQRVKIYEEDKLINSVYTSNTGRWLCYLPVDGDYTYRIEPGCGQHYESLFQTGEKELLLPAYDLNPASVPLLTLGGEVQDCNEQKMDNHFLLLEQDGEKSFLFMEKAGVAEKMIKCAQTSITLQSADEYLDQLSPKLTYNASIDDISFDKSYTCNAFKEGYFKLSMDGIQKTYTVMESRSIDGRTKLIVYDESNLISEFHIYFSGSEPRMYQDNELNIVFDQVEIGGLMYEINCSNSVDGCGFDNFEIEHYGEKKWGWIKGSFNGEFWVKTIDPVSASYKQIEGTFLVPRTFS